MNFMIKLSVNKNLFVKFVTNGLVFLCFLSIFFFTSCRYSPHKLGAEILPENARLKIYYGSWNGFHAYSYRADSVRTDELSRNLLGSLYDSTFGVTTASVYSQFVLSTNGISFGMNPQIDSVVLEMRYFDKIFGDTNTLQHIHIYELEDELHYDSVYYSNSFFKINPDEYADLVFYPRLHDSVVVGNDTLPPMLRVKLKNEFGQKILDADSSTLQDIDKFLSFFKGLAIISEPVYDRGALFAIDLKAKGSRLQFYYHNEAGDSLKYSLYVTANTAYVNRYEHNYSHSPQDFRQQVLEGDTLLGMEKFYVQGTGGVRTFIRIPDLRTWDIPERSALNEVKLVLPGKIISKLPPTRLALVRKTADGTYEPLIDQFEGESYFGGVYNKSNNEYIFRITRYMQKMLQDTDYENFGLYLFVSGASYSPENFVFKGSDVQDTTGMRMEIIYTDLD